MAIDTTFTREPQTEIIFPCLMELKPDETDTGFLVIIATGRNHKQTGFVGTLIHNSTNKGFSIGAHTPNWSNDFKPFNGSITINNK